MDATEEQVKMYVDDGALDKKILDRLVSARETLVDDMGFKNCLIAAVRNPYDNLIEVDATNEEITATDLGTGNSVTIDVKIMRVSACTRYEPKKGIFQSIWSFFFE